MKIHGRNCDYKENPCALDHEYLCKHCGLSFVTNKESSFQHPLSYRVSPSLFYPACSSTCYLEGDIDIEVIKEALSRGDMSQTEVDETLGTFEEWSNEENE